MSKPTPQYQCQSYYQDGEIRDCTCGKCAVTPARKEILGKIELNVRTRFFNDHKKDMEFLADDIEALLAATAQAARQEGYKQGRITGSAWLFNDMEKIRREGRVEGANALWRLLPPNKDILDAAEGFAILKRYVDAQAPAPQSKVCGECHGTGTLTTPYQQYHRDKPYKCPVCNGTGRIGEVK